MFKQLISNLAFSPSTIDQVSFYAKRLKQEQSIRRMGFALIIMSMFIQIFAAMVPPEKSLAASNNDVIYGGVSNLTELKNKYNGRADVKALYNHFGITAGDMTGAGVSNVTFNYQDQGARGTRTVGRVNFASTKDHNLGHFAGTTFYSRSAAEWQGTDAAYYFGKHKGADNKYYFVWVLKDCGNIAYRPADAPAPKPEPKPEPKPTPTPTPIVTPPVVATPPPAAPTVIPPGNTPKTTEPVPVCVNNPALKPDDVLCKCIDNPEITADHPDCKTPVRTKEARNITQNLTPETTILNKARASDTIEYTLMTTNHNVVDKTGYVVEDYIGDLLDYAVLDTTKLNSDGGTFDAATKTISFANQTIPAGKQLEKEFRVTLKSVIPSTNTPNKTATDFDCIMQNGYGNEVSIMVNCPVLKQVETLPNTGPGTTVAIGFTISVLSGYFFMRSRLLAKEVGIVKRSYQSGF